MLEKNESILLELDILFLVPNEVSMSQFSVPLIQCQKKASGAPKPVRWTKEGTLGVSSVSVFRKEQSLLRSQYLHI